MCPLCAATLIATVSGVSSAGGVTAFVARKLRSGTDAPATDDVGVLAAGAHATRSGRRPLDSSQEPIATSESAMKISKKQSSTMSLKWGTRGR
jgi:hypothetical protein